MLKLNLSDLESSDIKYKISKFPDGQQDIVISDIRKNGDNSYPKVITIQSRFNSWRDLELIVVSKKALDRMGVKDISLYIPYLLGSRSDRLFQQGGNSYLVDVIAPIINVLNFNKVTTIDVHSDVAAACIKNLEVIDNYNLVYKFLSLNVDIRNTVIISPDAGAEKKIYPLLQKLNYTGELVTAKKHRDLVTGDILETIVPLTNKCLDKDFVIIDDICDGGRTFMEVAKLIKNNRVFSNSKVYLIVTHGIFSAGFKELGKYFDGIYCTNSIKDVADFEGNDVVKTNVKQFKVI